MAEMPEAHKAPVENVFFGTVRQPRVMLLLLGVWSIIGALAEFFTSSGIFTDLHDIEVDGALAGRALGWESIPLAVLYLYCTRNPDRYHGVFWLALIQQGVAIIAGVYHWGAGTFTFESVAAPIVVSAGLAGLVFLHIFQPKAAPA